MKRFFFLITVFALVAIPSRAQDGYMTDTVSTTWKPDTLLANGGSHTQVINLGSGVLSSARSYRDTGATDGSYRSRFIQIPVGQNMIYDTPRSSSPNIFWFKSTGSSAIKIVRW